MSTIASIHGGGIEPAGNRLRGVVNAESAGWLASCGAHVTLLALLAFGTLNMPASQPDRDLVTPRLELDEPEVSREFFSSDRQFDEIGALSHSGQDRAISAAYDLSDESLATVDADLLGALGDVPIVEIDMDSFTSPDVIDAAAIQGVGNVGTTGAEGAIDRLTHEIVRSLEAQPTLVVWLFDESGSLGEERAAILKRFDRIYEELGVIEAAESPAFRHHDDKPLLTAVVGFGETARLLTKRPTDQLDEIKAAVGSLENSTSNTENVFQAVALAADEFHRYRLRRQGSRHVMFVVFTDESGDDVGHVDQTVNLCRKYGISVYVVGRPAPFGREFAYVKWVDPDPNFDQRPQWPPVRLGPESFAPERLKIHFIDRGTTDFLLDSGFGPFALTRLCYETGGLYFSAHPNRAVGRRVTAGEIDNLSAHFAAFFDPEVMQPYQPDYVSWDDYQELLRENRARAALVEAAQMSWTSPMGDVRVRFPKRDEASLAESLSVAQRSAAILHPKIDQICQVLLAGAADRDKLVEPRWQAGYDLAAGRAVALKVRTEGYNAALAMAKRGMQFASAKNNTWILKPDDAFANTALEQLADEATESLVRVVEEHPGTPWAMLAEQELSEPLGWQWKEGFTKLPSDENSAGNRRRPNRRPDDAPPQRPPRRDPPPL